MVTDLTLPRVVDRGREVRRPGQAPVQVIITLKHLAATLPHHPTCAHSPSGAVAPTIGNTPKRILRCLRASSVATEAVGQVQPSC